MIFLVVCAISLFNVCISVSHNIFHVTILGQWTKTRKLTSLYQQTILDSRLSRNSIFLTLQICWNLILSPVFNQIVINILCFPIEISFVTDFNMSKASHYVLLGKVNMFLLRFRERSLVFNPFFGTYLYKMKEEEILNVVNAVSVLSPLWALQWSSIV